MSTRRFCVSFIVLAITASAFGQATPKLDMVSSGAMRDIGGHVAQQLQLSPDKPAAIKKLPADLKSPLFGMLKFRLASGAQEVAVVLDAPADGKTRLFVDANGNGDLTDDPATTWDATSPTHDEGSALLEIGDKNRPENANVVFYRFHDDPARKQFKNILFYYRDYALIGSLTLGSKTYKAALEDDFCTGDFRGQAPATGPNSRLGSGVALLLDTNGDGSLHMVPGKRFDVAQPFNIGGVTYEVRDMTPGGQFSIAKSAQSVAEVLPPPNLMDGQPAPAFEATTMDGKAVHFPADFKGKIVLLDFWATWCGPCMVQVPSLVATYQKFHSRGLEVLGISLDEPNSADKVKDVTAKNNMTWPEVYDGKTWQAAVAQLYGIQSIPHPILVDGNTGKIISAMQMDLAGGALDWTVERNLPDKSGATGGAAAAHLDNNTPTFTGKVIDAVTHKPVDEFMATAGWKTNPVQAEPIFDSGNRRTDPFHDGTYTLSPRASNLPPMQLQWFVRIEARGYLPAVSEAQENSGEVNFELTPSKDIVGHVYGLDGKPAAKVTLGVVTPGAINNMSIQRGTLVVRAGTSTISGDDGSFDLAPQTGKFLVVACNAEGAGQADQDEIRNSTDIHLQKWGQIEGDLILGGKPVAGTNIMVSTASSPTQQLQVMFSAGTGTDANGHFSIAKVLPGEMRVSRMAKEYSGPDKQMNMAAETLIQQVTVESGKTAIIRLGVGGREVAGKVILPAELTSGQYLIGEATPIVAPVPQMPYEIKQQTPEEQRRWTQSFARTPAGREYFQAHPAEAPTAENLWLEFIDAHTFRIEGVKPGTYHIDLHVNAQYRVGSVQMSQGEATFTVAPITPDVADKPLEIPNIKMSAIMSAAQFQAEVAQETVTSFTGKVTDALTQKPVDGVIAIVGYAPAATQPINYVTSPAQRSSQFDGGKYALSTSRDLPPGCSWFVHVEAPGYLSTLSAAEAGSGTVDFALTPGKNIIGHIYESDGTPATGVSVAVGHAGMSDLAVQNGVLHSFTSVPSITAADGSYQLPPQAGQFVVVACGPSGIAQVNQDDIARSADIHLHAWDGIKGQAKIGNAPAAVVELVASSQIPKPGGGLTGFEPPADAEQPAIPVIVNARTDVDGHFFFPEIRPGTTWIWRRVYQRITLQDVHINVIGMTQVARTNIKTEETLVTMVLTGGGRRVTSKMILPDGISGGQYNLASTVTLTPSAAAGGMHCLEFKNDGTFYVEDVHTGDYQIQVSLTRVGINTAPSPPIKGKTTFTMPPITPDLIDKPLEIPDFEILGK